MGFGHMACFFPPPIEEQIRCGYHSAQKPTFTLIVSLLTLERIFETCATFRSASTDWWLPAT